MTSSHPLKRWNSSKGSVRLCVSSVLTDAFAGAWSVEGQTSNVKRRSYDHRRAFSASSPVTCAPSHPDRAPQRNGITPVPPWSGIQPTGDHHLRPTSETGRGGWFSGFLTRRGVDAKRPLRSKAPCTIGQRHHSRAEQSRV